MYWGKCVFFLVNSFKDDTIVDTSKFQNLLSHKSSHNTILLSFLHELYYYNNQLNLCKTNANHTSLKANFIIYQETNINFNIQIFKTLSYLIFIHQQINRLIFLFTIRTNFNPKGVEIPTDADTCVFTYPCIQQNKSYIQSIVIIPPFAWSFYVALQSLKHIIYIVFINAIIRIILIQLCTVFLFIK